MGSRQGRATSVSAGRIVIGEELYGRVEIAAVSSSSKCFLPCRHSRFLDQGSTEIQKLMREKPHVHGCKMWHCGRPPMAQNGPGRMSAMSPLCARKRTSLESRLFGAVPPAERRLSAQPSPPSNKPQHGRSVPQPWRGHLSGDRSILCKLGYVVTEIGETQRILPHAISQELVA